MQFSGVVEKELVANGCIGLPCDVDTEANTKEVGVLTFDEEADGVSVEIVNPPLEFAFAGKDVVVVTEAPQHTMLAIVEASVSFAVRFSLQRRRRSRVNPKHQTAIMLISACFETFDDLAKMLPSTFFHIKDAMQMVRHDL